jgi:hypothetical protein
MPLPYETWVANPLFKGGRGGLSRLSITNRAVLLLLPSRSKITDFCSLVADHRSMLVVSTQPNSLTSLLKS